MSETTIKFYDRKKEVYRTLFREGKELYFCYQGAEYRHKPEDYVSVFNSVVSKDEDSRQIRVVDSHRSGEECQLNRKYLPTFDPRFDL